MVNCNRWRKQLPPRKRASREVVEEVEGFLKVYETSKVAEKICGLKEAPPLLARAKDYPFFTFENWRLHRPQPPPLTSNAS